MQSGGFLPSSSSDSNSVTSDDLLISSFLRLNPSKTPQDFDQLAPPYEFMPPDGPHLGYRQREKLLGKAEHNRRRQEQMKCQSRRLEVAGMGFGYKPGEGVRTMSSAAAGEGGRGGRGSSPLTRVSQYTEPPSSPSSGSSSPFSHHGSSGSSYSSCSSVPSPSSPFPPPPTPPPRSWNHLPPPKTVSSTPVSGYRDQDFEGLDMNRFPSPYPMPERYVTPFQHHHQQQQQHAIVGVGAGGENQYQYYLTDEGFAAIEEDPYAYAVMMGGMGPHQFYEQESGEGGSGGGGDDYAYYYQHQSGGAGYGY